MVTAETGAEELAWTELAETDEAAEELAWTELAEAEEAEAEELAWAELTEADEVEAELTWAELAEDVGLDEAGTDDETTLVVDGIATTAVLWMVVVDGVATAGVLWMVVVETDEQLWAAGAWIWPSPI